MGFEPPLSVFTDYQRTHTLPKIADFFLAFPRIAGAPKEFTSDVKILDYLRLAIPYAATAVFVLLLALIANFYFFFKVGVVPGADDSKESDPNKRDATGRAFLVFSFFLHLGIFLCVAHSLSSAFKMNQAAQNSHVTLKGFRSFTEDATLRTIDTLLKAGKTPLPEINDDDSILRKEIRDMLERHSPQLETLKDLIKEMPSSMSELDDKLRYFSVHYFQFTIIILLLCCIGCLVIVLADTTTPNARKARIIAFAFLLLPLIATWTHTAISSSAAVASSMYNCTSFHKIWFHLLMINTTNLCLILFSSHHRRFLSSYG